MGEAKRRGTFEERKAQAIAADREKGRPVPAPLRLPNPAYLAALHTIGMAFLRAKKIG